MTDTRRACKYCGSVFPHLRFADGCEWKVSKSDIALSCECGSVKWSILKSGEIECAKCLKCSEWRAVK